ncbi:MAG: Gldg family protein [Verrucomicrobiota bacterium]|nr:Gldg family protein [Verrucomicrobiota bacterium]
MKKKGFKIYLYSTVGVVAMFVILVAVNLIAARGKARIDLTAERAYTLSPGTRQILSKLDTPVQIRFYCTRGENAMPVFLKTYAQRVEDLLGEYRQASKGQIDIQKLDPVPDSDAEDSAKLDGIEGQSMQLGSEPIYLGVSVSMLDQKEAIPFLAPDRERLLEYDLSRAISRVMTPEKPVVGVMSPLPVSGQQMNPMMMRMGQRGQPPWVIMSELQRDFTVKPVEMSADKIPDDVKALLLIHPKGISDAAQYAIDQFVLRGGKLIAFLDPLSVLDPQASQMGMPGMSGPSSSSLDKLLKAWGLTFDTTQVVADLDYVAQTRQGRAPTALLLNEKAMNQDDVLTADTDSLFYVFGGAFSGTPVEGLKQTVLIKSSKNSQLVDPMSAQFGGEKIIQDFNASGTEYALAVRLSGKFKTAFPEGKPKAPEEPKPEGEKPEEKKPEQPTEQGLKESAQENVVLLVGDCDLIQDQIAVTEAMNPFGGQRMVMPANGNLAFAQGAIEQFTGDSNLIAVRSRASRERPFTVVKQMQADAEANYRSKIKELETSLAEAQRKLNELQQTKAPESGQRFILSPEQQQEIENFRKKEAEMKQQLKQERKKLRASIDSLENRTKWLNIAGMPALVAVAGVGLAVVRRRRRAAR